MWHKRPNEIKNFPNHKKNNSAPPAPPTDSHCVRIRKMNSMNRSVCIVVFSFNIFLVFLFYKFVAFFHWALRERDAKSRWLRPNIQEVILLFCRNNCYFCLNIDRTQPYEMDVLATRQCVFSVFGEILCLCRNTTTTKTAWMRFVYSTSSFRFHYRFNAKRIHVRNDNFLAAVQGCISKWTIHRRRRRRQRAISDNHEHDKYYTYCINTHSRQWVRK